MRAKRVLQECTIPGHVPGDVHSTQLTRKNEKLSHLEAENAALKAILGVENREWETLRILAELAAALITGEEAGWSYPQHPSDSEGRRAGKPNSKAPSGGHPGARSATYVLRRTTENAVDAFNTKKDNDWRGFYRLEQDEESDEG